jgi:hypothetical protein
MGMDTLSNASMDCARTRVRRPGGVAALMAFAALVLQLLFPAGLMADASGAATHGLRIVICTAEGRIASNWDAPVDHGPKKAPAKPMASCPFAGHATAVSPPAPQVLVERVSFDRPPQSKRPEALSPGRGLAAPPPPAIGPPVLI